MLKFLHWQLVYLSSRKKSILATVQGWGGNRTHNRTTTKGRDPNKSYVEGLNNIESWRVKKSEEKLPGSPRLVVVPQAARHGREIWWNVHELFNQQSRWMGWRETGEKRSPQKGQVLAYKGLWKLNWNYCKWKMTQSVLIDDVWNLHWLWNVPGLYKTWLESTTSKARGAGWGTARKMVTYDLLFHLFTTFDPLPHGTESTSLNTIYISTWKSSLTEVSFSPRWRNTLGNIQLNTMDESTVCYTILTNNISSNPVPQIVVPFTPPPSTLTITISSEVE